MFNQSTFDLLTWTAQNAVNIILQSTILIVIGLMAARMFRSAGSAVQSVIYRATLVAVLVCPIVAILISNLGWTGWTIKLPAPTRLVSVEVPVSVPKVAAIAPVLNDREFSDERNLNQVLPGHIEIVEPRVSFENPGVGERSIPLSDSAPLAPTSAMEAESEAVESMPIAPTETVEQEVANTFWVGTYWSILSVWILGSLLLLIRLVFAYRKIYQLRAQSPLAPQTELEICHQMASELKVAAPGVHRNSLISSPCLTGITCPAILLPAEIEDHVALEKAFAHELAHLRRRDNVWNLIQRVALSLFFFQPLLWRLVYRMETTAEEVCDDFVVRHCLDRTGYAQQLVELAESNLLAPNMAGLGMFNSKSMLGHRVVRILDTTRKLTTQVSPPMIGAIGSLAFSAAILCGLIGDRVPVEKLTVDSDLDAQKVADEDSMLRFSGRVVDENGFPIAGAKVSAFPDRYVVLSRIVESEPYAVTASGADGSFQIEIEKSKVLPLPRFERDENVNLVVTKQGYAIQWAVRRVWLTSYTAIPIQKNELTNEFLPVEIPLSKDHSPIEIKLVDTEGAPIKNALVKIESVDTLQNGGTEAFIKAASEGIAYRDIISRHRDARIFHHGLPNYTSDENGVVVIDAIGEDRIAQLVISGNGICITPASILTCQTQPISFEEGGMYSRSIEFLGRQATVTCEPSQLIRGTVVDSESGRPLAGAIVQSYSASGNVSFSHGRVRVVTDSKGCFELDGMPKGPGNRIALIPNDDQPYFMQRFDVPEQEGYQPINMTLEATKGIWIGGKAVDSDTGDPIVDAWMHYSPFLSNKLAQESGVFDGGFQIIQGRYMTQDDGSFRLVGLPGKAVVGISEHSGKYPVGIGWDTFSDDELHKNGQAARTFGPSPGPKWPTATKKIAVADDAADYQVNFEISTGLSVPIKIVGPDGQPLLGVATDRLGSINDHGRILKSSTTRAGGFKPNEKRWIKFVHDGKKLGCITQLDSSTFADQNGPVEIRLQPFATVRGRLVNNDGEPVSNAMLRLDAEKGDFSLRLPDEFSSNGEGIFKYDSVLVGATYDIIGDVPGAVFLAGRDLDVPKSEMIDMGTINVDQGIDTLLSKPKRSPLNARSAILRFTGKVVDEAGSPIEGVTVKAMPSRDVVNSEIVASEPLAVTNCGTNGEFEIEFDSSLIPKEPKYEFDENVTLVFTKPGYQINWADRLVYPGRSTIPIRKDESTGSYLPVDIVLRADTQPLKITLVDTEGAPISNAKISVTVVRNLKPDGSERMIKAADQGANFHTIFRELFDDEIFNHGLPDYTSDENGEVVITGLGHNRTVTVAISRSGIRRTGIDVLMFDTQPFSFDYGGMMSLKIKYHGIHSTVTCEPSQLIRGRLVDSETGQPLVGAIVQSSEFAGDGFSGNGLLKVTTGRDGRFELDGMPKGSGNVIAAIPSDDHPYFMTRFEVPENEGFEPIEMTLKVKKGIWIQGKAIDAESGDPIVGAWMYYLPFLSNPFAQKSGVYDENQDMEIQHRYLTGKDGSYRLVGLPGKAVVGIEEADGQYPVGIGWENFSQDEVESNGRYARTFSRPVRPGPKWPTAMKKVDIAENVTSHQVNFEIGMGLAVPIKIVGPDGKPLRHVVADRLASSRDHGSEIENGFAIAGGFKPNEKRWIRFVHRQKKLGRIIELDSSSFANQRKPVEIRLMPFAKVRGKFVNRDGDPVANVMVRFDVGGGSDFGMQLGEVSSGSDGVYEHDEVLVGTNYSLAAQTPGDIFAGGKDIDVPVSELIDVGTINVDREYEDPLPEPKRSPLKTVKGNDSVTGVQEPMDSVSGRVLLPGGKPAAGMVVAVLQSDWIDGYGWVHNQIESVKTDVDGRYELEYPSLSKENNPEQNFNQHSTLMAAFHSEFVPAAAKLNVEQRSNSQELKLLPPDIRTYKLVDIEGQPIAGAKIELHQIDTGMTGISSRDLYVKRTPAARIWETNDQGEFTVECIGKARSCMAWVLADGFETQYVNLVPDKFEDSPIGKMARAVGLPVEQPQDGMNYAPSDPIVCGPSMRVSGVVKDSKTGRPLAGVQVSCGRVSNRSLSATSDEQGRYQIDGLKQSDNLSFKVDPTRDQCYLKQNFMVRRPAQTHHKFDIELNKGIWIEGQVINKQSGKPVKDAVVYHFPLSDNPNIKGYPEYNRQFVLPLFNKQYFTDDEGRFRMVGIKGPAVFGVVKNGYATLGSQLDQFTGKLAMMHVQSLGEWFSAGEAVDFQDDSNQKDLQIDPGQSVVVKMVDEAGDPVAGVSMKVLNHSSNQEVQQSDDTFSIDHFAVDERRLVKFWHPERKIAIIQELSLEDAGDESKLVELKPYASVKLNIENEGGVATNGHVRFGLPDGAGLSLTEPFPMVPVGMEMAPQQGQKDGEYFFDEVPVGVDFDISFFTNPPARNHKLVDDLELASDEVLDLGTFRIGKNGVTRLVSESANRVPGQPATDSRVKFSGVIVDANDQGVSGVEISVGKGISTISGDDGTFEFEMAKEKADQSPRGLYVRLSKKGFGPSLGRIKPGQRESARLTIVSDSYPIDGKLVDTEGNPIEGAFISVEQILPFDGYDLETLIEKAKDSTESVSLPNPGIIQSLDKVVTTGANGRFRISGIGDNRLAVLKISGKTCAIQSIGVLTTKFAQIENVNRRYSMLSSQPQKVFGHLPTIVAEPSAPIVGVVMDEKTKEPIAGVTVASYCFADNDEFSKTVDVKILKTTTDEEGRFELNGMPVGVGNEIVVYTDPKANIPNPYLAHVFEVPLAAGIDPIEMNLPVIKGHWIRGQVVSHETKQPMSKISVKYTAAPDNAFLAGLAFSQRPRIHQHLNTDDKGRFKLVGMPGLGFVTALVHHETGYPSGQGWDAISKEHRRGLRHPFSPQRTTAIKAVEVGDGDAEVKIEISRGNTVRVTTVDQNNQPVNGVTLTYLPDYVQNTKRMESSEFDAPEFSPGKKRKILFSNNEQGIGAFREIGLEDSPVKIILEPMATLRLKCVDADGNGTGEADIDLGLMQDGYVAYRIQDVPRPDQDGNFEIKLVPGKYAFNFESVVGFSGYKKVDLKPGAIFNLGEIDVSKKIFKHVMSSPRENPLDQVPFDTSKSY